MKIARVITICVVLISMFLDAEAVRSKRRSQPKDHLPQSKYQNGTNTNEIFTTSRPEAPRPEMTRNQQTLHTNIPLGAKKKTLTVRTDRSKPSRSRGVNRYKANRRRRQLQHSGAKSGVHTGRSYDVKENYIENQQIETVQGPAEAFDEGAVRIEPVYRVTKNRNILDSIVDIVKKIVDPPKPLGPLVGPFNFPGIGDKVYIRLLEPLNSNHLMIRLITHLPATEIESTFDKNILPPTEIIEHPEVSIISHESLPLSKEGLIGSYEHHHSDVHSISSDSLLSSSDNVVQVSKPSNAHVQNIGRTNGYTTGNRNFRTYKLNFKHGNVHGVQKLGHHKRHPSLVSPSRNNHVNSVFPFKLPDQANKTQGSQRATGFQGSVDHVYPYYPSLNESNNEHSKLLTIDFQQLQTPINVSVSEHATYSNPTTSYDRFPNVETFTSPRIPTSINQERQSKNNSKGSTEDGPIYSIEFASKNMRYLNLDGSVEPAIKNSNDEGFKPMELSPVHSKVPRSVDPHWKVRKGINVRPSETIESSTSKANHGGLQKRSVGNGDAFLETIRNLNDDRMNYLNTRPRPRPRRSRRSRSVARKNNKIRMRSLVPMNNMKTGRR